MNTAHSLLPDTWSMVPCRLLCSPKAHPHFRLEVPHDGEKPFKILGADKVLFMAPATPPPELQLSTPHGYQKADARLCRDELLHAVGVEYLEVKHTQASVRISRSEVADAGVFMPVPLNDPG